jgi:diketogulonate reductase-like aldo/keto reductase
MAQHQAHTADLPLGLDEGEFRLGYGTYEVSLDRMGKEAYVDVLETVLDSGYRHLDTAEVYDTEPHVAAAIDRSDLTRDDVFVATKVSWENLAYEDLVDTAGESRETLGVDAIDLLYVHVPYDTYDPEETTAALDHLVDTGVVDRIGLSNFTPELARQAIDHLDTPVFAHQVECHPLLQQDDLRQLAVDDGHWLVGFSPYIKGFVREIEELNEIADKHGTTPFRVSLAWLLSKQNVAVLSHSTTPAHIRTNSRWPSFDLDDEDLALIEGIDRKFRAWDGRIDPWNQPPDQFE